VVFAIGTGSAAGIEVCASTGGDASILGQEIRENLRAEWYFFFSFSISILFFI
jgi:hypothetical protein